MLRVSQRSGTGCSPSSRPRNCASRPLPFILTRISGGLDDSLPELARVIARRELFDVVMLSAVWMHLDETQRRRAMPNTARLVRTGGLTIMSLRYGPVPFGRRMYAVPAEETIRLAESEGLTLALKRSSQDGVLRGPGVSWTRLAFARPLGAAI
jgi:hypothetical protein